ncbi:MAG: DUF6588 family protein [Bacteroidota bacterium]
MKRLLSLLTMATIGLGVVKAQDLEDFVSKYTDENGSGYLQPLSDAFGANMNTGWFRHAKVNKKKFQFYIGVVTTAGLLKDEQKTFQATSLFSDQTVTAPSIFGSTESVINSDPGGSGLEENFPGGADFSILPLAVPQLSVGGLFGTEFSVRYFAFDAGEDVGDLDVKGFGIRHSISQYFKLIPVDISLAFYTQSFQLGDIVDANARIIMAQVGKRLAIVDFYGGIGYEFSTMDIQYDLEVAGEDPTPISFELEGENSLRLTAGFMLNLGPVKLNADYNLGDTNVFSVGFGFGFGIPKPGVL